MSATSTPVPMGLLCLVILLALPATGLNCNLLKLQQRKWNRETVELLKGMKTRIPPECLQKMPTVSFPVKILGIRQPWAATKAVLEMLHGFLHLFKDEHLWDAWEAPLRKRFLVKLHEQSRRVQRCLGGGKPMPGTRREEWMMHKLQLKNYFRIIENFLEAKGLDRCTQAFVRHEIQVDLTYIDRLTEKMEI